MISSRELAFNILVQALQHRSYINLQLKGVSHPDMPFVNALVYGVVQNLIQCQSMFQPYTKQKVSEPVNVILCMSAYQKHFMNDIPDYAIKSEAMKLAKKHTPYAKAFIHAMIEKILVAQKRIAQSSEDSEAVALETSFPLWIIKMWQAHYGCDFAYQFAQFSNQPSPIFGFVHYHNNEALSSYGQPVSSRGFLADKSLLTHPDFIQKKVFIADIHAQVVGFNTPIQPHQKVLDACGAPGGKSIMMAMSVTDQAEIICSDVSEHRCELVKKVVSQARLKSIHVQVMDARQTHEHFDSNTFDGVLADVPCSGLGVLRRKPEIKHFITPEDIDQLITLQADILESCSKVLKVNGWLVYSTCTLNKKENEKQIERFLAHHDDFSCESITPFDSFKTGGDGFFMATLRKIK